jgi:rhamnogalacturonyl hydrolase YesR
MFVAIGGGLCAAGRSLAFPKPQRTRLHEALPPGVSAILQRFLAQDPSSLNTDWFGTMPLLGALQWCRRGVVEVKPFAQAWLAHHLETDAVAKYTGNRSRSIRAGGIPLTTYAGHFGIAQVCEEMVAQFQDERARKVAQDVAAIVLHRTARNHLGLIAHDDTADFAIPDVTFFAVSALLIGAALDPRNASAYRDQALTQLRTSLDTFLDKETGLARTLYRESGIGKTHWTRASGWLLWAMTELTRLGADHDARAYAGTLRVLVEGMLRVQEPNGGFHVLLDEPDTPLDSSGPAMFALAVHKLVRHGWLPVRYRAPAVRAWDFVKSNLSDDGVLRNVYYLWALPAEAREMRLRDETSGWAMGFVLAAANEMTL